MALAASGIERRVLAGEHVAICNRDPAAASRSYENRPLSPVDAARSGVALLGRYSLAGSLQRIRGRERI